MFCTTAGYPEVVHFCAVQYGAVETIREMFLGEDSPGRHAAPGSGYRPLVGFPQELRIIVADDERDTVETLVAILKDEGHDARAVYRAKDVLFNIRRFEPHVVVLDISMPEVSGYEIAKEIRRQLGVNRPLLIAISGVYKKETDKLLSQAVGFDHHLTKPCSPEDLLALLAPLANP
jgi:CheY-like chemotaxis protein